MSAEDWEKIKTCFAAALELPEVDRRSYLARACGDRTDLLRMIEDLLASHWSSQTVSHAHGEQWVPMFACGELVGGRYRIIRPIARGGIGEVYEASDERLRLRLALKTLRSELLADQGALARFERELLVARDVAHENLCRLFDFVEHTTSEGSAPCLTMELLEGESLADFLNRERPLCTEAAFPMIREIGLAISTLHDHGIIHRDLKPSNVMLASRHQRARQAVVTDFGLAKAKNSERELFESQADFRAGAPYFMAPELLRGGEPSVASDVYAFGLLIDEFVTRARAYSCDSLQSLYFAKLWELPCPPRDRAENLPAHWNTAILRCLEGDPSRRFASIHEVLAAVESPGQSGTTNRRHILATTGAAIVALTAGGGTLRLLQGKPTSTRLGIFDIENRADSQFEYVCRGTIAELMRRLGNMDGIEVMRLHASQREASPSQVPQFALGGSLRAEDGQLHLNMTLSDSSSRKIVWAEDFAPRLPQANAVMPVGNLLQMQTQIASRTAAALQRELGLGFQVSGVIRRWRRTTALMPQSPTTNNVAFDHFLRGQTLLQEASPTSVPAAIASFEKALAEDPRFGLVHAALAEAYLHWSKYEQLRADEFTRTARLYATQALQQQPELPEAHAVMGAVRQHEWNWEGAEKSYNEALRLKPRFARALRWRAGLVLQFGRFDDAIHGMEQARTLDPYDRTSASGHGLTLFLSGRLREAIDLLENAIDGRLMTGARHNLGQAYARLACLVQPKSESMQLFERALQQARAVRDAEAARPVLATQMFALILSMKGELHEADPYLRQLEIDVSNRVSSSDRLAWVYSVRKETEQALQLLERALLVRDSSLLYVRIHPFLENVRSHPRFQAILNAMRLG